MHITADGVANAAGATLLTLLSIHFVVAVLHNLGVTDVPEPYRFALVYGVWVPAIVLVVGIVAKKHK
jgi:hypothetical protein